jgi:hypothetical protein
MPVAGGLLQPQEIANVSQVKESRAAGDFDTLRSKTDNFREQKARSTRRNAAMREQGR